MSYFRPQLLVIVVLVSCYCSFAVAAEKGGSGVFGADLIALEKFKKTGMCPDENPKQLCQRIDKKILSLKWELRNMSEEELIEEEFYYVCCFKDYPSKKE